jgi:hypothetical protein
MTYCFGEINIIIPSRGVFSRYEGHDLALINDGYWTGAVCGGIQDLNQSSSHRFWHLYGPLNLESLPAIFLPESRVS